MKREIVERLVSFVSQCRFQHFQHFQLRWPSFAVFF